MMYWFSQRGIEGEDRKSYRCESGHQPVYGLGKECWLCGSAELDVGVSPYITAPHKYDRSVRDVSVGNGKVHIRRELANLL